MIYNIDNVTPRPWFTTGLEIPSVCDCYFPGDEQHIGRANAAHIVHCVNSHEALVAALEEARYWLERAAAWAEHDADASALNAQADKARAALAAAKGKKS